MGTGTQASGNERVFAAVGVAGAVLASSCCVIPVVLVLLGLGGAWVGQLTALLPYKPYFLTGTAIALGLGFWHVYVRPTPACAPGSLCTLPATRRVTKTVLCLASCLALAAATVDMWAPFFY